MSTCVVLRRQYLSEGTGFGTINGFLVDLGRIYKLGFMTLISPTWLSS